MLPRKRITHEARPHHRRFPARRAVGHRRALAQPEIHRGVGKAGRGRERSRRSRQHRSEPRGKGGGGWLYAGATSSAQIVVNPSLYKLPYDPVKDFVPISQVSISSDILVVHNAVPAKNVRELVALAKARPRDLTFASGGSGGQNHLAGELLKSMAGIDISHIPYKGSPLAIPDLLGGRVTMMFSEMSMALPLVRERKLRGLAVTSLIARRRFPSCRPWTSLGFGNLKSRHGTACSRLPGRQRQSSASSISIPSGC